MCAAALPALKRAARQRAAVEARGVGAEEVRRQSSALLALLLASPEWAASRRVGLFLPLAVGGEPDTMPLLRAALAQGKRVFLPLVRGPGAGDLTMLALHSEEELALFSSSKYGVREPPDAFLAGPAAGSKRPSCFDSDEAAAAGVEGRGGCPHLIDLLLVPGLAFDRRCFRLGHGKGYYDSFISRLRAAWGHQRQRPSLPLPLPLQLPPSGGAAAAMVSPPPPPLLPAPRIIGLALDAQLLSAADSVPREPHDERLDAVVTAGTGFLRATAQSEEASLLA